MKVSIKTKHLLALMAVTPKEDVRYYLNGIFINLKEGRIVATDGHRLLSVPCDIVGIDRRRNYDNIILALPNFKPKKSGAEEVQIDLDIHEQDARWYFTDRAMVTSSMTTKFIDGKYPEYQQIIDKAMAPAKRGSKKVGFNPRYLYDVTVALDMAGCALNLHGSDNAFYVTFDEDQHGLIYIVMPMRI